MGLTPADFITAEIHERSVELGDGEDHVLHFRELPNTDLKKYALWQTSGDEDVRAGAEARLLALGLCTAAGEPVLTHEEAAQLRLPILRRLVTALLEVNGYTGRANGEASPAPGKTSARKRKSGSGTSSR